MFTKHNIKPENIKHRIDNKLKNNPHLLYHIDNPFLEKYIDIIIEAICEELVNVSKTTSSNVKNELNPKRRF